MTSYHWQTVTYLAVVQSFCTLWFTSLDITWSDALWSTCTPGQLSICNFLLQLYWLL